MGTRHLTCVVLNNKFVCAQYGQWDGYPTGAGQTVVDFLMSADLDRFREQCARIAEWTDAEVDAIMPTTGGYAAYEEFTRAHPELSRDTGADILQYIMDTPEPCLQLSTDFARDGLFCEWAYVVDLDTNTLEVYKGFNHTRPAKGRFAQLDDPTEEYTPVTLVASYSFSELTPDTMTMLDEDLSDS